MNRDMPVQGPALLSSEVGHDRREISEDQPLLASVVTQTTDRVEHLKHGNIIILCTLIVPFLGCAMNSLVTLNILQISSEFGLDPGVEIWPMSMHYLAQGCTFLLAGSLADALGSRKAFLVGCILQNLCFMASGSAQSGMELITSRILSGIAYPMCFISAMKLHREILPVGKLQNLAVDYTRKSQYLGSAAGIVLSASLSVSASWRWGFHCAAILGNLTLLLSSWAIPRPTTTKRISWSTLTEEIDWSGTFLASSLMALLFYALALITTNVAVLSKSGLFVPLALGWVFLVSFLFWQDCWETDNTRGVRDSLWANSHFLSMGLIIFFVYASSTSTSQLIVFVLQRAQGLSVFQSSWQTLSIPVIGFFSSTCVGLFLPRIRANIVLSVTIAISSLAPLLMAILNADLTQWGSVIFAASLSPVASSTVIPIAAVMVSEKIAYEMRELAMGVLCTIAMMGASVGLALAALISYDVTANDLQISDGKVSLPGYSGAWMSGYRVAFIFLMMLNLAGLAIIVSFLRKIGYLGRAQNLI